MLNNTRSALIASLVIGCASLFLVSCATDQKASSAGAPALAADGTPIYVNPPKEIASFHVNDPEPPAIPDKELDTIPPEMQSKVELWVAYFQGKGRGHMERYLARSTRYIKLMKVIMRNNGLPEDLVYIALIESGFSSRATSRAAAVGYWQFIKGTGRRYGLEINSFVDDRRDPVLSTQAAAEYFKGLYSVFGSWYLSMASYNVGENRVKREMIKSYAHDFWELAKKRRFPKETANYVPKFIAARLIAKNPEKYGFSEIDYDKPQEFELVRFDKPVNLKMMAEKMGMDYEDFKIMNPKYRGEVAPVKGELGLELRVPVGQTQVAMKAAIESVAQKVEFVADAGETENYKVRSGDSLYTIARHYHTTVAWLRDVNDMKAGRKLRIGMRIQVPDMAGGSRKASKVAKKEKPVKVAGVNRPAKREKDDVETAANAELVTGKDVYYVVQPGDTLSSIADDYDATINELRKMNRLGKKSLIKVGMKLKVPKDEGLPTDIENEKFAGGSAAVFAQNANSVEALSHKVRAGENLTVIAKQYGVSVQDLRDANKLKKKSKITEGMTLLIPVKNKPSSSVGSATKKPKITGLKISKTKKHTYHAHVRLKSIHKRKHHPVRDSDEDQILAKK